MAMAGPAACYHGLDDGSGDTDSGAVCDESGGAVYGNQAAWDTAAEDWDDVNEVGFEQYPVPTEDAQLPERAGTGPLAVHALHLETKKIMMYHGHQDNFVWKIKDLTRPGGEGLQMQWHPMAIRQTWRTHVDGECGNLNDPPVYAERDDPDYRFDTVDAWPNLFCTGHAQMWDGRVFLAGGDVTGAPCGGGLRNAFIYDPRATDFGDQGNYGWVQAPDMLVDRWYPTVTALPTGELLVTSGNSQDPNNDGDTSDGGETTRIIELFDPFDPLGYGWQRTCSSDHGIVGATRCLTNQITEPGSPPCSGGDTCNSVVPNFPEEEWPSYPLISVLPDGNVLYAGGEAFTGTSPLTGSAACS